MNPPFDYRTKYHRPRRTPLSDEIKRCGDEKSAISPVWVRALIRMIKYPPCLCEMSWNIQSEMVMLPFVMLRMDGMRGDRTSRVTSAHRFQTAIRIGTTGIGSLSPYSVRTSATGAPLRLVSVMVKGTKRVRMHWWVTRPVRAKRSGLVSVDGGSGHEGGQIIG